MTFERLAGGRRPQFPLRAAILHSPGMWLARVLMVALLVGVAEPAAAQTGRKAANIEAVEAERESPWLIALQICSPRASCRCR